MAVDIAMHVRWTIIAMDTTDSAVQLARIHWLQPDGHPVVRIQSTC